MKKFNQYHDEYIHPFWLGIIILFSVIIFMSIICLIRKKFGKSILHLYNHLCCKNQSNISENKTINLSLNHPHHWPPVYIPAPSLSPKLYKLVQNIHMINSDKATSIDTNDNDDFSITDELNQESTNKRDLETARKFYASMRHTTQSQKSSSIDSSNEFSILPMNQTEKLKSFHTSRFLQSLRNKH